MAMQSRDASVEGQWVLALGWIDMKYMLGSIASWWSQASFCVFGTTTSARGLTAEPKVLHHRTHSAMHAVG